MADPFFSALGEPKEGAALDPFAPDPFAPDNPIDQGAAVQGTLNDPFVTTTTEPPTTDPASPGGFQISDQAAPVAPSMGEAFSPQFHGVLRDTYRINSAADVAQVVAGYGKDLQEGREELAKRAATLIISGEEFKNSTHRKARLEAVEVQIEEELRRAMGSAATATAAATVPEPEEDSFYSALDNRFGGAALRGLGDVVELARLVLPTDDTSFVDRQLTDVSKFLTESGDEISQDVVVAAEERTQARLDAIWQGEGTGSRKVLQSLGTMFSSDGAQFATLMLADSAGYLVPSVLTGAGVAAAGTRTVASIAPTVASGRVANTISRATTAGTIGGQAGASASREAVEAHDQMDINALKAQPGWARAKAIVETREGVRGLSGDELDDAIRAEMRDSIGDDAFNIAFGVTAAASYIAPFTEGAINRVVAQRFLGSNVALSSGVSGSGTLSRMFRAGALEGGFEALEEMGQSAAPDIARRMNEGGVDLYTAGREAVRDPAIQQAGFLGGFLGVGTGGALGAFNSRDSVESSRDGRDAAKAKRDQKREREAQKLIDRREKNRRAKLTPAQAAEEDRQRELQRRQPQSSDGVAGAIAGVLDQTEARTPTPTVAAPQRQQADTAQNTEPPAEAQVTPPDPLLSSFLSGQGGRVDPNNPLVQAEFQEALDVAETRLMLREEVAEAMEAGTLGAHVSRAAAVNKRFPGFTTDAANPRFGRMSSHMESNDFSDAVVSGQLGGNFEVVYSDSGKALAVDMGRQRRALGVMTENGPRWVESVLDAGAQADLSQEQRNTMAEVDAASRELLIQAAVEVQPHLSDRELLDYIDGQINDAPAYAVATPTTGVPQTPAASRVGEANPAFDPFIARGLERSQSLREEITEDARLLAEDLQALAQEVDPQVRTATDPAADIILPDVDVEMDGAEFIGATAQAASNMVERVNGIFTAATPDHAAQRAAFFQSFGLSTQQREHMVEAMEATNPATALRNLSQSANSETVREAAHEARMLRTRAHMLERRLGRMLQGPDGQQIADLLGEASAMAVAFQTDAVAATVDQIELVHRNVHPFPAEMPSRLAVGDSQSQALDDPFLSAQEAFRRSEGQRLAANSTGERVVVVGRARPRKMHSPANLSGQVRETVASYNQIATALGAARASVKPGERLTQEQRDRLEQLSTEFQDRRVKLAQFHAAREILNNPGVSTPELVRHLAHHYGLDRDQTSNAILAAQGFVREAQPGEAQGLSTRLRNATAAHVEAQAAAVEEATAISVDGQTDARMAMPDLDPAARVDFTTLDQFARQQQAALNHLGLTVTAVSSPTDPRLDRFRGNKVNFGGLLYTVPETGNAHVFLVQSKLGSIDEAQAVLNHEVVGHFGVRRTLGDGAYGKLIAAVQATGTGTATTRGERELRERFRELRNELLADARRNGVARSVVTNWLVSEELVARLAEEDMTPLADSRAVAELIAGLNSAGVSTTNVNQLQSILQHAAATITSDRFAEQLHERGVAARRTRKATEPDGSVVANTFSTRNLTRWFNTVEPMAVLERFLRGTARNDPANATAAALAPQATRLRQLLDTSRNVRKTIEASQDATRAELVAALDEVNETFVGEYTQEEVAQFVSDYVKAKHLVERNENEVILYGDLSSDQMAQQRQALIEAADQQYLAVRQTNPELGRRHARTVVYDQLHADIRALTVTDPIMQRSLNRVRTSRRGGSAGEGSFRAPEILTHIERQLGPSFAQMMERTGDQPGVMEALRSVADIIIDNDATSGIRAGEGELRAARLNYKNYVPLFDRGLTREDRKLRRGQQMHAEYINEQLETISLSRENTSRADFKRRADGRSSMFDTMDSVEAVERELNRSVENIVHNRINRQIRDLFVGLQADADGVGSLGAVAFSTDSGNVVVERNLPYFIPGEFDENGRPKVNPALTAKELYPDTFYIWNDDGTFDRIQMRDRELYKALTDRFDTDLRTPFDPAKAPHALVSAFEGMATATRFLGKSMTTYAPRFVLGTQNARDFQANIGIALLEQGITLNEAANMPATYGRVVAPLNSFFQLQTLAAKEERLQEWRQLDESDPRRSFAELWDAGGVQSLDDQFNITPQRLDLSRRLGVVGRQAQTAVDAMARVGSFLDGMADGMDNTNRTMLMHALLQSDNPLTGDRFTAAEAADVVVSTMNFNQRSEVGRVLSPFFAFSQAAMTGNHAAITRRIWQNGEPPLVQTPGANGAIEERLAPGWWNQLNGRFILGRLALGFGKIFMAAAMLGEMGGEDEDGDGFNDLSKIDPSDMMRNLFLPFADPVSGAPLKVPTQYGAGMVLDSIGAAAGLIAMGHDSGTVLGALTNVVAQNVAPLNASFGTSVDAKTLVGTMLPNLTVPALEVAFGETIDGRPLRPGGGGFGSQADGAYSKSFIGTEEFWRSVAQDLNDLTGGNIDWPAESIRAIAMGYTGGIGTEFRRALRVVQDSMEGNPDAIANFVTSGVGLVGVGANYHGVRNYYAHIEGPSRKIDNLIAKAVEKDGGDPNGQFSAELKRAYPGIVQLNTVGNLSSVASKIRGEVIKDIGSINAEIRAARRSNDPAVRQTVFGLREQVRLRYEKGAKQLRDLFAGTDLALYHPAVI